MRKPYLDNIRWGTVLLVMVYHVFYAFNACGVLGGVGHFADVQYQDALLYVCYPWFMVLLFLVAGICSRYSLEKRSHKEFIRTRTRKLLVPCTVGLIAFQWITGYFNVLASGGFETMRETVPDEAKPFAYTITCILSGIGPMWFIQMLWLFSLLLVLIRKLDKKDVLWKLGEKANIPVILLLFLPMWGAAQILNTPVITVYRFGIYGLAYFLGYFVFSHESVQDRVQRMHLPMLIAAVILAVVYVIVYFGQNYAEDAVLKSLLTAVYLWAAVLAILGCGQTWWNKSNAVTTWLAQRSFGFYILHYLPLAAAAYLLYHHTALPPVLIYLLTAVVLFAGTWLLYEGISRIPVLRWCVLGIKAEKKK